MRPIYRYAIFCAALMLTLAAGSRVCRAGGYRIAGLVARGSPGAGAGLYGIDDGGAVVLDGTTSLPCAGACYLTYQNGVFVNSSAAAPALDFDDGTACSPAVPLGFVLERAVCNEGMEAFTGVEAGSSRAGVYDGPELGSDLLAWGGEGPLMLNAHGDILWEDRSSKEVYEAINMPSVQEESIDLATPKAPEPGSVVLLGTGALLLALVKMRKAKA